jgi:hypothetical protein
LGATAVYLIVKPLMYLINVITLHSNFSYFWIKPIWLSFEKIDVDCSDYNFGNLFECFLKFHCHKNVSRHTFLIYKMLLLTRFPSIAYGKEWEPSELSFPNQTRTRFFCMLLQRAPNTRAIKLSFLYWISFYF